jgi:hypothetical protein
MGEDSLPTCGSETTTIISSISPTVEINVEPVGRGYEKYLRVIHNLESIDLSSPEDSINNLRASTGVQDNGDGDSQNFESAKKKTHSLDHLVEKDYYDVLGLGDLRYNASQDDIKRACMLAFGDEGRVVSSPSSFSYSSSYSSSSSASSSSSSHR